MELTITQNGALYAMHHRAVKNIRSARRKRAIPNKTIRIDNTRPDVWTDRRTKMEEICYI